jgi:hypothetical protein
MLQVAGRVLTFEVRIEVAALPPPPAPNACQRFVVAQIYRLKPTVALVLKKTSPLLQVGGRAPPTLAGLVRVALEKSTLFDCVRKSTKVVWVTAATDTANNNIVNLIILALHFQSDNINGEFRYRLAESINMSLNVWKQNRILNEPAV